MTASVGQAITSNRGLLTYPVVRPLDAVLAKFITDLLTMFVVGVVLYTGIIRYYALPVTLDLAAIFNGFLLMGLLGLGFGTLNCVIFRFWPTWRQFWSVLTKPLFVISCMFYTFESLPTQAQAVMWYNPLNHAVGLMRSGFYSGYEPLYVSPLYVLGLAFSGFLVGAYLLRRHRSALLEAEERGGAGFRDVGLATARKRPRAGGLGGFPGAPQLDPAALGRGRAGKGR